jgi:peptidoglycan/LPS O-acetylase OafA/YrhL
MHFNNNIKFLHAIRGVCALLVVIYHAKFALWAGGTLWVANHGFKTIMDYILFSIDMLSSCGKQCVLVFFLLSGFVIYHSFSKSDKKIKHFYLLRIVRIYVPFLFSLLFAVITLFLVCKWDKGIAVDGVREYNTRLLIAYNEIGIQTLFKSIFFISSKEYAGFQAAYWSLLHEAIFYIVFPIYFFLKYTYRVILFILMIILYIITKSDYFYFQLFFLIGMFLYDYYKKERKLVLHFSKIYLLLILLGFIAVNLLEKINCSPILPDIAALFTTLLLFDYLLIKGINYNKYLEKLGDISFTLYLNHLPVLMICYAIFYSLFGKLIFYERYPYYIGVVMSLLVSMVLYNLIELKSLSLIKKIKEKWSLSI